jgi:uncharacterized membrane protein
MADTRTKLALGVFLGTVVYLLIALRTVVGSIDTVPNLAITIGTALILTSVVVLLFFVHHLARAIVADTIIERVGATLDAYADALLPEKTATPSDRPEDIASAPTAGQPFTSDATGYIQAIDHSALVSAAGNAGARVSLRFRQGQFVLSGDILGWATPPEVLDEALSSNLAGAIVLGAERTPVQDLEYAIRQLVEIALRALSPGVNDPFTAAAVIDRATGSIAHIMKRGSAQSAWCDGQGVTRLIIPATRFDGLLGATFHQVRQAGATKPAILIRLVDRLGQLLGHADANQAKAIVRHIELVGDTGQNGIADEADRLALRDRVAKALDGRV